MRLENPREKALERSRPIAAGPVSWRQTLNVISREFQRLNASSVPKYMQLHKAVLGSVQTGLLRPADQIPPEYLLAERLGISLGTIRRALAHLAAGGVISRQHGRGTFVATHSRELGDSWHFRFVAPDGTGFLPVYSHVVDRHITLEDGPWSYALGADPTGYLRITRCFNVDDKFLSYSEFYLRRDQFASMMDLPVHELESVNLKKVLEERFALPTIQITQRVQVLQFNDAACDIMSLLRRTVGLLLEVVAYTLGNVPLSYHRIYVPPTGYPLDLSLVQVPPGTKGTVD